MKTFAWTRRIAGAAIAAASLCSVPHQAADAADRDRRAPMALVLPTQVSNAFTVALFGRLRTQPGNVFFSPFSVRTALDMARAGAAGKTATQMAAVLGEETSPGALPLDVEAISNRLRAAGGGELKVANSLWAQEGAAIRPQFLREIGSRHAGEIRSADFKRDAGRATSDINQWVEGRTKGKIRQLIPPGGLDAATRLVLANAIYFKGLWASKFDREETRDEAFHLDGGGTVQAPLMRQESFLAYMEGDDFQAVELPYRGRDLSMLVLLPRRLDGLRDLEAGLSDQMLRACAERLESRQVRCVLPRFRFTTESIDLRPALAALGMTLPFDLTAADFSGINGLRAPDPDALCITSVFHKAFVEVNEEGTEAAASTGVIFGRAMAPPPPKYVDFRADHPFLFAIWDRNSGSILFLGRVADPTQAG